jgi:branched-chain amino acid transport system substrate-binding protein
MKRALAAAGIAAATILTVTACSSGGGGGGADDPIVIAHVGDYSGDYSFYDVPIRDGLEIAVEEINAEGGIEGRQVELITTDARGDQAESVRGVEEALDAGAIYIVGTTASGPWQAQATVACEEGVPISTGDGTSPTLVLGAGDCAYHMLMLDTVQGAVAASHALELGYESAYVLGSSDDSYTAGLPKYFIDAFEEGGGEVVADEEFRIGATDFNVQVADIAAASPAPDFIYTSMFTPDTPQFLRQLRAAGVTIPVISGDGSVDSSVLEAGAAAEGLIATFHAWPADGNPIGEWLAEHYPDAEASSVPQNIVSAVGYDEVYIIKQAIEAAGEATSEALMEQLPGLEYEGVTGSLVIDPETHQATKETTLISVQDGEYVFLDSFVPDYVPTVG